MEPGFYNMDCMAAMKQFPDGFFDLAIVDPPYGINIASHHCGKVVGGGTEDSVVNPVYRAAKSRVATRNFITPSPMTVRRTKGISQSWRG